MKRVFSVLAAGLFSAQLSWAADISLFEGFVVLRSTGVDNSFYDTDTPTINPDFTGIVSYVGQDEYLLMGGEVKSTRTLVDGQPVFGNNVRLNYTINGGETNSILLPRIVSGSPDQWQSATTTGMVNIASGLASGSHQIRVWFTGGVSHPLAPGQTMRLPATGAYEAVVYIIPKAPDLVAKDDAAQPIYAFGFTNGVNGGFGFGPWTTVVQRLNDGDAAGFFIATNPPNVDLNHIAEEGVAWGAFANEGGTGGDDVQIAAAFRPLPAPLAVGQTLSIDIEHGGIQSGNLLAELGPRVGGFVGIGLREYPPTLANDPDPINAFAGINNNIVLFGFRGGDSEYVIMDIQQTSGRPTGLPYTTNGVRLKITRTGETELLYEATSKGSDSVRVVFTAELGSTNLAWLSVYNRNAELNDVYFNNLLLEDAPSTNLVAYDDAADSVYLSGWNNGANGGFGFTNWVFFSTNGIGGSAGHFLATNPPNTDLNFIATGQRAWGAYANDAGNPGAGIQSALATRGLPGMNLLKGQTLGFSLEHGGVSPVNGSVEIAIAGTPTFPNPTGIEFSWSFAGGGTMYRYVDMRLDQRSTRYPFSFDGMKFDFTLVDDNPFLYALRVEAFGTIAGTRYYYGLLNSSPRSIQLRIFDVEENDVFFNRLYVRGETVVVDGDEDGMPDDWEEDNGLDPNVNDAYVDDDLDGMFNIEEFIAGTDPQDENSYFQATDMVTIPGHVVGIYVPSVTGRAYALEYTTNLLGGMWSTVPGQSNVSGTGSALMLTNMLSDQSLFRLRVFMQP